MAGQGGSCARGHRGTCVGDQVLSGAQVAALGGAVNGEAAPDAAVAQAEAVLAAAGVEAAVTAPVSPVAVVSGTRALTPDAMQQQFQAGARVLGTGVGAAADGRHRYRIGRARSGRQTVIRITHTPPDNPLGEHLADLPLPVNASDDDLRSLLQHAVQTVQTHHQALPGATSIPTGNGTSDPPSAPSPDAAPLLGGEAYDYRQFTASEYRRSADQGPPVWDDPPLQMGARIAVASQPAAQSSARRSGNAPPPLHGTLTVGRTTVPALGVLRAAEIVEHEGGVIALYDEDHRLLAVYDPRTRTAGQPAPPDGASLTPPQMAAVIAHYLRQEPSDPLIAALRQDVETVHQGGTPLAGADSAYLLLQRDLHHQGQHIHFGATVEPARYPAPSQASAVSPQPSALAASPVYELEAGRLGVDSPRFDRTFRQRMNSIHARWNRPQQRWEFDAVQRDAVEQWHTEAFGPPPAQTARQAQPAAQQTLQTEAEAAAAQRAERQQTAQEAAQQVPPDGAYATSMAAFQAAYDAARERQARGEAVVPFLTENATGGLAHPATGRGFGIEIEFVGGDKAAIAHDLHAAGLTRTPHQQGYHRSIADGQRGLWRFERDCTVDGEIISPVLHDTPAHWQQLQQVIAIVKRHGGHVNQRCGGHIHIGCGDYDHSLGNHSRLVNSVAAQQDILYRLAHDPAADYHRELRGSTWSSPVDKHPEGFRSLDEVRRTLGNHQVALNFQSVTGTRGDHVEFRLWDGSLDAGTIQAQIKLSLALTDHATRASNNEVAAIPDQQRGTHDQRNPSGERLTGAAWAQQTAAFRQFVDRYFERPADKAQITALFAVTQWQPRTPPTARQQQQRALRKRSDVDTTALRSTYTPTPVTSQADGAEVAAFLRQHAPQAPERSAGTIAGNPDAYAVVRNGLGEVVASAEVTRNASSGWYQADVTTFASTAPTIPTLTSALVEQTRRQRAQALSLALPADHTAHADALHAAGWRPVATTAATDDQPARTLWYRSADPLPTQPLPTPRPASNTPRPADSATIRHGSAFTERDDERVADLITTCNQLTRRYDRRVIQSLRHEYLVAKDGRGTVQGCVAVRALNGTVAEVRHLSVDASVAGQGYGRRLLQAAEERAHEMGAQVLQATARADNDASRVLLLQTGYTRTTTFRNDRSGHTIEVWHRPLGHTLPADIRPPPAAAALAAEGESWWQQQMARLLSRGYSEEEARRMLVGLLRRMGRPVPGGTEG